MLRNCLHQKGELGHLEQSEGVRDSPTGPSRTVPRGLHTRRLIGRSVGSRRPPRRVVSAWPAWAEAGD